MARSPTSTAFRLVADLGFPCVCPLSEEGMKNSAANCHWQNSRAGTVIVMTGVGIELSRRERAILRAVAAGRGVLISSCEPDLTVDGCWCDHVAVHNLLQVGLIKGERQVGYGQPTPAVVTRAGGAVLAEAAEKAA